MWQQSSIHPTRVNTMNLFEQYQEKILFELYDGKDIIAARKILHEVMLDVVAAAQFDYKSVDVFLGFEEE